MAMGDMIGKSIKFEDWKGDTRMGTIVSILENGDYEVSTDRGMALVKKVEIIKMRRGGGIPKATQMKREKVAKVMHEFKEGKLRSGSKRGPVVKDRDQAIAIALSEAGMSKKMATGGGVDRYDKMIPKIDKANKAAQDLMDYLKSNGVVVLGIEMADYDTDAQIDLENEYYIQISITGNISLDYYDESEGAFYHGKMMPISQESFKKILEQIKSKTPKMAKGGDVNQNILDDFWSKNYAALMNYVSNENMFDEFVNLGLDEESANNEIEQKSKDQALTLLHLYYNKYGKKGLDDLKNHIDNSDKSMDKFILSFNFDSEKMSLGEVQQILGKYSKDWKTKRDQNKVTMLVTIKRTELSKAVKELKSYGIFRGFEMRKSGYDVKMARGGGVPEYVPVSQKQNKAEVDRFIEYVNMFYGKGADAMGKDGYTKAQIKTAVVKYLNDLDKEYTWGYGDSLDRERVYSYLMNPKQEGINNPSFSKGGSTWKHKMAQGGVITKSDVSKMQKINIRGFEAYMPGIRTIYFDQNSGKFFYPFDESEFFELKNDYTLGKLNSFLKEKNITLKTKMAQGSISKNAEYVSKRNIDKVTYHKGKDVKNVSGEDLLDGVYVSKKVGSKKGFYVELASEPDIDYGYDITKKLKLQKVPITSIEDAQSKVRKYIADNNLGGGNWTGGDVYKDGKKIGRISYNGRWWSEESNEMAQGGSMGKDKYTVSIDWELSKPRIKYGRKIFKDIFANSNKEAESIAVEQWNSVKANSNKKVLSINSINMTELNKKPIMAQGGSTNGSDDQYWEIIENANWLSDHDYNRVQKYFSKLPKPTKDGLKKFISQKYSELYKTFEKAWLAKPGIPVSDDGWSDLLYEVIGRGENFYNSITVAKLKKMAKDLDYRESFGYTILYSRGGSMGWKHKMAKGAKLKVEEQYHPSKYLTKEQWEKWNEYVKTGKIDGKKENNMFAVARWVGASVSNINGYEIEQRAKKLK